MPEGSATPGMIEDAEVLPSAYRFFMPKPDLTAAIIEQNHQLVEQVQMDFSSGYTTELEPEGGESLVESERGTDPRDLERPDSYLLKSLQNLGIDQPSGEGPTPPDHDRQIHATQREIAERLYNYLYSLAESPWAREDPDFIISECIPRGMATMLGLSVDPDVSTDSSQVIQIRNILNSLTEEFRDWLVKENGEFITPWFQISLQAPDVMRLIVLEEEEVSEPDPSAAQVGQTYLGEVTRVVDFGAFVEILPGTDGLLHISEIADYRVRDVRDELEVGQQIYVKVIQKEGDRIKLSRKAVLSNSESQAASDSVKA